MTANSPDKRGAPGAPRLLDQVRTKIRARHYSLRTEQADVHWIKRFILYHGKRHPRDMGAPEVEGFRSMPAVERRVAPSTQNQALAAVLFLYRDVLGVELPWLQDVTGAKTRERLPVVLSRAEVHRLFAHLRERHGLMARLLFGTGMRLMECLRLRVKDLDFERREVMVRAGKGGKDRRTMLPAALVLPY